MHERGKGYCPLQQNHINVASGMHVVGWVSQAIKRATFSQEAERLHTCFNQYPSAASIRTVKSCLNSSKNCYYMFHVGDAYFAHKNMHLVFPRQLLPEPDCLGTYFEFNLNSRMFKTSFLFALVPNYFCSWKELVAIWITIAIQEC